MLYSQIDDTIHAHIAAGTEKPTESLHQNKARKKAEEVILWLPSESSHLTSTTATDPSSLIFSTQSQQGNNPKEQGLFCANYKQRPPALFFKRESVLALPPEKQNKFVSMDAYSYRIVLKVSPAGPLKTTSKMSLWWGKVHLDMHYDFKLPIRENCWLFLMNFSVMSTFLGKKNKHKTTHKTSIKMNNVCIQYQVWEIKEKIPHTSVLQTAAHLLPGIFLPPCFF